MVVLTSATARAEDVPDKRVKSAADYVHTEAWVGAMWFASAARYDLEVRAASGRAGRAVFDGEREGPAAALGAGLGFRLIPQLTVGARLEFVRALAPLNHEFLNAIGVRIEPLSNATFLSVFADGRGRGPWHGGLAVGYVHIREQLLSPAMVWRDRGELGFDFSGGYRYALPRELSLDVALHWLLASERLLNWEHADVNESGSVNALELRTTLAFR
jgi:hypothetical protein